jgi:hypothetical protein
VDLELGADLRAICSFLAVALRPFSNCSNSSSTFAVVLGQQLQRVLLALSAIDASCCGSGTFGARDRFRAEGPRMRHLNDTETLSPVLPNETEEAARRLLSKAASGT